MQSKLSFTKMHGTGNDYLFLDAITHSAPIHLAQLAVNMSHRHTGIGADGLIIIHPSTIADARMQMFNADGTEAEMCGNGLRCVGKFLYDHQICCKENLTIETACGILSLQLFVNNKLVHQVRINMGLPIFDPAQIPTTLEGKPPVDVIISGIENYSVTTLSMGNPHCVVFVEDLSDELILNLGPHIEQHAAFPNRTNVGFAKIISPSTIELRVWERGSGETLACGTGACAAVVAAILTKGVDRTVTCDMRGGLLQIEWEDGGEVFLTGEAVEVFQGYWNHCE